MLKIHYKIGDNVKKNDVLFTLDSKDILRNIEQISAEMKYEKETLDILEKKLSLRLSKVQNANNLKKQNIITQDNLSRRKVENARELKVKIIDQDEFLMMLKNTS